MLFCIFLLNILIYLVKFVYTLENPLLLSVDPNVDVYRVYENDSRLIFNDELKQEIVVFNSDKLKTVVAKFGSFSSFTTITTVSTASNMSVLVHTDRNVFLSTQSDRIVVNSLCEFFYDSSDMSNLDNKFCCVVELHFNHKNQANPRSVCQLRLGPRPSYCFIPLFVTNTRVTSASITATVYRSQSNDCAAVPSHIYAVSPPVSLSFSNQPPSIWYLADHTYGQLLFGLPLHSSRPGENLLIPIRLISLSTFVDTQKMSLHCIIDDRMTLIAILPNSPFVAILSNVSSSNSSHTYHTLQLKITTRRDSQLVALNITLNADSTVYGINSVSPAIQCCLRQVSGDKYRNVDCGQARIMTVPVEINSFILIPALKIPGNTYFIYHTPNITLSASSIKVYSVVNLRDRTVREVSQLIEISVMDRHRINISDQQISILNLEINYQNIINPWSMQLSIYGCKSMILSPVKIWIAESWRIVLSNDVIRRIKGWMVPKSGNTDTIKCVSPFKVARLKVLCRLYMLDESGHKQYAGSNNLQSADQPFVDVTDLTNISQFRIRPANVITFEKSPDNSHFLVAANSLNGASLIELLSPESSEVIVSARVSVESDVESFHVVDLIVRCVDALSLSRQKNRTENAGKWANEFETVTVSLSMNLSSLPCYLLVFLVFNDQSVERVSSFDSEHYQMFLVTFDSHPISKMAISNGQLVTVKWTKNTNISIMESSACMTPNVIFSKQINWNDLVPKQFPATKVPFNINSQTPINQTNQLIVGYESSNNILHIVIYVSIAMLALCLLCLILHRIFCSNRRLHRHQNHAATCYNISDSGFLSEHSKVVLKNSNSKTFSSLGKCSGNCVRTGNNNKCHYSEPYPPLLPPPGPISTNYDLSINDLACGDSAVDSGIELGKLSNYSSNTNPSNDMCCSVVDDNLYRPSAQFGAPLFGAYHPHKDIMESIYSTNDKPCIAVNLRAMQW